jgi:hypothetical protein
MGHYFVRYKREFVITVIVITEFDSMYDLKMMAVKDMWSVFGGSFSKHKRRSQEGNLFQFFTNKTSIRPVS